MLYPVERRGRTHAQGHVGRSACRERDTRSLQNTPDGPRLSNRDRRLTFDALGLQQPLDAQLAGAGEPV
jgi:hypothetical protein